MPEKTKKSKSSAPAIVAEIAEKVRAGRLGPTSVLRIARTNPVERRRTSLDVIAAIEGAKPGEATVAFVLAKAADTATLAKSAPRSAEAKSDPIRFVRGYLTDLVRAGYVEVV